MECFTTFRYFFSAFYIPLKNFFLIFSIVNQNIQNQIQLIKITEEQFLLLNINDLFYFNHVSTRGPPRISPKVS